MLPIKWDSKDKTNALDVFENSLKNNKYNWIKKEYELYLKNENSCWNINLIDLNNNCKTNEDQKIKQTISEYNTMQYYYPEVQQIIFDQIVQKNSKENRKVSNYELKFEEAKYCINTIDDNYELELDKVKLAVYPMGVAILTFIAVNTKYETMDAILKINQRGRRVKWPFVGIDENENEIDFNLSESNLVADQLKINFEVSNLDNIDGKIKFNKEIDKKASDKIYVLPINNIISELLGNKFQLKNKKVNYNSVGEIDYDLVIDDRMYVVSSCFNKKIYRNISKSKNSNYWYKYIFVDENGESDLNEEFIRKLVEKHTYSRWKAHRFGISNYSFVCIGDVNGFNENVVDNHITGMYYEMAVIHLMQKASLQKFSEELARCTDLKEFLEIQEKYLYFIDNYCFEYLTAQEQGIELFNMVKDITQIQSKIDSVNSKINQTSEFYQNKKNQEVSKQINFLTGIATVIGILSYYESIRTSYFEFNIKGIPIFMGKMIKKTESEIGGYISNMINIKTIVDIVILGIVIFGISKFMQRLFLNKK